MIYWSRDPDGTQHNQGDSAGAFWPGINEDTSRLAVRNADHNLKLVLDWLNADPKIAADTDVLVTSDHGFATISKQAIDGSGRMTDSATVSIDYDDESHGALPPGFLAIELAQHLGLPLYDPDVLAKDEHGNSVFASIDLHTQHPAQGNGLFGGLGRFLGDTDADVIVTPGGGFVRSTCQSTMQRCSGALWNTLVGLTMSARCSFMIATVECRAHCR